MLKKINVFNLIKLAKKNKPIKSKIVNVWRPKITKKGDKNGQMIVPPKIGCFGEDKNLGILGSPKSATPNASTNSIPEKWYASFPPSKI